MEIKFQRRNRVFSLCIGYQTKWFGQISFITLTEEFYENLEVVYADLIYQSKLFRQKTKDV